VARALIIVDVQRDFTPPDGALAVPHGDEVIAPINELAASSAYDLVVATRCWHPPDHSSFQSQGGPWPAHCVRGTPGAEFHPALDQSTFDAVIDKGVERSDPGYSAFENTPLQALLEREGVDSLTITGLATDYCVRQTALDALGLGLRVEIPIAAVRGIDDADARRAIDELAEAGAHVIADGEGAPSAPESHV
jgi:nicotinamidase/pyrazinamidase